MAMNKMIWRRLNSAGYGVQSPNDFYFVQHVLRETGIYYAYATLSEMTKVDGISLSRYPEAIDRLLFRIANHVHPATIVELGAGASALAMAMACPTAQLVAITSNLEEGDSLQHLLASYPKAEVKKGEEMELFEQSLAQYGGTVMLHVAHTTHYREVVQRALACADDHMVIVVEGLDDSKEKLEWWHRLCEDVSTSICYDLGSLGVVFLDRSRHKKTYWINIRK